MVVKGNKIHFNIISDCGISRILYTCNTMSINVIKAKHLLSVNVDNCSYHIGILNTSEGVNIMVIYF